MGSLVGGKLAASGNYNVSFLSGWKEHVEKINRQGLSLTNMDHTVQQVQGIYAASSVEEILERYNGKVDVAMVLVKSPNTKKAADQAARLLHYNKNGLVLTLQNGLGNKEIIAEALGDSLRVVQGVTSMGSMLPESGKVLHTGNGPTSISFDPNNYREVKDIAEMLIYSGIPCNLIQDVEGMLWGKLLVNAGINPVTALLRVKNGAIVDNETCKELMLKTVHEGANVAKARGVMLPYDDPFQRVLEVANATKENVSSMLSDVLRGAKTEIDSINGAIVKEGEKLGIPVLTNKTLVNLVSSLSIVGNAAPRKAFE
jgi:2-dehydropantoate 2-reductase